MSVLRSSGSSVSCVQHQGSRPALANRWGVSSGPVPRKTVWAEVTLVPAGPPVLPSPLGQAKTSATEPFRGPGHISRTT
ncbi:hypothetical protein CWE27_31930 [Streptomyces sp. EAG2]|nr:hypothetical protein CWE27_31930 [Streptomyces sp. EAG2]